jgi:hypothetical protein
MASANLMPASGHQDHATSPSALALSSEAPSASTASRPAFVTFAKHPSVGQDGGGYRGDLGKNETGIFLQRGLDSRSTEQPVGQITLIGFNNSCSVRRAESVQRSHQCFGWRSHSPSAQLDCRPCPRRQLPVESYQRTGPEPRLNFQAVMGDRR